MYNRLISPGASHDPPARSPSPESRRPSYCEGGAINDQYRRQQDRRLLRQVRASQWGVFVDAAMKQRLRAWLAQPKEVLVDDAMPLGWQGLTDLLDAADVLDVTMANLAACTVLLREYRHAHCTRAEPCAVCRDVDVALVTAGQQP